MSRDEADVLARLAAAITDETPVDWDGEIAAHPAAAPALGGLRLIERIASVHRAGPGAPETTADGDEADEPILFRWGHLEIRELLGEGGFGEVYRARDPRLGRDVALKLLRPDLAGPSLQVTRFLAEARRMARVRHPNVAAIQGADEHDGRPGIWMELATGPTLEERLEREGPLGASEAAAIGIELCRALAAVHAAGLVHGDVKAANVLRDAEGRTVLADFGAGRELAAGGGGAGTLLGTPLTVAPEVFAGAPPGPAADLYALGALLYRLVTGRYPVTGASVEELRQRLERGERPPLLDLRPDLPASFAAAVERALAAAPERRPRSAGELGAALAASLAGGPADRPQAAGTAAPDRRRRRVAPVATVAAAAILLGLTLLALLSGPGSPSALQASATLYRSHGDAREPLGEGALVRPGETLFMEYRGSGPAHVYVLNEDQAGDLFLLFPLPGQDLRNPLAGERWHRLPGARDGVPQDWQVTGGNGREAFLVVASRRRLGWLAERLADLPAASPDRVLERVPLPEGGPSGERGIGGVLPAGADGEVAAGSRLAALARELARRTDDAGGLWTREYVIFNAGR